ncbi:unnamed protein product [Rotaria sordida]|uniref:Neuroendocrine protein 7B2 n=1 Tax=Rotaria sordida TaxID=392033 RepID=A0A814J0C1_9BILA|nr:unnamed protein product [Rotaria sordida]CAF1361355.1 unnamed protein product [Rotaria sordida]CAF1498699.1 unnamed protein product [Rotaria sordida]CAF1554514.1 unnamed protein product [Rotaria sordida]CAF3879151.1 unnamed protein product [Rotaria sordida]
MWYSLSTFITAILILIMCKHIQGTDWIDYAESSSNVDTTFDDDSDQYLSALTRDEEQEIHSPFITGYKYVSGGAGEGRQHLSPSGQIPNRLEVKTDEELPSYCDPPNPCPLGFESDDCDASSMSKFTGEYSRLYQARQDCQCDNDHDECFLNNILYTVPPHSSSSGILKRARRIRRDTHRQKQKQNDTKAHLQRNQFHKGHTLRLHVAKKSPTSITS